MSSKAFSVSSTSSWEKLLDAIMTGCVPIYWGYPSVADLFDPRSLLNHPLQRCLLSFPLGMLVNSNISVACCCREYPCGAWCFLVLCALVVCCRGIITFEILDELEPILTQLSAADYSSRLEAVERNFKTAMAIQSTTPWMTNVRRRLVTSSGVATGLCDDGSA